MKVIDELFYVIFSQYIFEISPISVVHLLVADEFGLHHLKVDRQEQRVCMLSFTR